MNRYEKLLAISVKSPQQLSTAVVNKTYKKVNVSSPPISGGNSTIVVYL